MIEGTLVNPMSRILPCAALVAGLTAVANPGLLLHARREELTLARDAVYRRYRRAVRRRVVPRVY